MEPTPNTNRKPEFKPVPHLPLDPKAVEKGRTELGQALSGPKKALNKDVEKAVDGTMTKEALSEEGKRAFRELAKNLSEADVNAVVSKIGPDL